MENNIPSSNATIVNVESGSVFVIKAGQGAVLVTGNYQLKPDEVLLVTPGANATVSGQGQQLHIHDSQSTVSIVPNATGPIATALSSDVQINPENAQNANFTESDIADIQRAVMNQQDPTQHIVNPGQSAEQQQEQGQQPAQSDDIASIQQSILAGQDPTQVAEAPAAGESGGTTANNSFVSVNYNYDAVLTEAGYNTKGFDREYKDEEDNRAVLIAKGGENLDVEVTEGDLDSGAGYPTESTASVVVEKGTYSLDPSSFYIPQESVDSLITELNAEITSGGEPVEFTYDAETNTFTGMQDGESIVSFDVDFIALPNGDLTVSITTTVDQPIDHISGDNSGMVTNIGDDIHIEFPVSGSDVNGNEIDEPIHIGIDINDGANEQFGTDTGTTVNESDDRDTVINGQVPLDLGSDEIASITFNSDQPSLEGLTSNGEPTEYTVDGNVVTVTDINGDPVLTVEVQTDGSYTVEVTGPLDQDADDITNLDLGITATDDDGDTANGTVVINIEDGENAADVSDSVTVEEGDLENPDAGNAYPVHGSSSVTIASPDDNLNPSTLRLSDEGKAQLASEMGEITTHNGQPVEFSMTTDENGVVTISAVDGEGNAVLDITMTPTMSDNGDVTVTTEVNQYQPLDEMNGEGNIDGLITNNGDVISIDLPLEIDDTDGDTSNVDITVNFEDGQDPSFGDDTGVTITESDDTQTVSGSIEFDNGSDQVDQIVFDANQPSLEGITSNGEATSVVVDGSNLSLVDADGNPVMAVTIDAQGNYDVTQYQPIDQNDGDITNIELNVSGTDADGDTANGTIHINIEDGENAADVADDVTVTEGDLENPDAGNAYPVHGSSSVTIASPDDNLNPSTLRLSDEGKAQLASEMGEITTHNGQPVEFSMTTDENGVVTISGVDAEGNAVLDITMTPTMSDNGDVTVTTEVNQYQPLDEMNGEGNIDGLITNNGDVISIDLPLEIDDTDGDTSNVDITVNFEDGQDPSFGDDTGVTITESDDTQTVSGSIEFDNGSDQVDQIVFDANQPSLDGITSNGEATSVVVDGSTLTLVDVNGDPVMDVTIDAQGNYDVTQYQPIDQNDGDITNIELNVSGTDADGDTANGTIHINIEDGENAADVADDVTVTEGDLENPDAGNAYPVHGSSSVTIESPSDNLDPSSLRLSDEGKAQLASEMGEITTHNGQPVEFSMTTDENGVVTISAVDGEGNPVLDITMTPTMSDNGDVTVVTDVNQYQPLDDMNGEGNTDGLISNNGDVISIDLPLEIDDTDGDTSNVDITVNFEDGQDPSFGDDTGVSLTESDDTQTVSGSIEFDNGSDQVDQIVFDANQPSLDGITSNGEATSVVVEGSNLSLVDADGNPVMAVTIDANGNYEVTQYQPIDQNDGDITNIELNVSGTDADGDTANGTIHINIEDGENAADVADDVTVTEGDLENPDAGNAYPVHGSSSVTIASPDDNLNPSTLRLSDEGKAQLASEMGEITTHNGQPVEFSMTTDENGVVTISGVDAEGNAVLDITMTPTMSDNGDVTVTTEVNQYQPLDEMNGEGNIDGLITNNGDVISIDLPLEIDDTDGDTSNVDITVNFEDGQDPSFGDDTGVTITESDDTQTVSGSIEFDNGSDQVDQIVFDANQPSLDGITSNGEATSVVVDGSTLTLVDVNGDPVMDVTIDAQGNYDVTQYQPIDQNDGDITNIELNVSGTDADGDTANGTIHINIEDGENAADVADDVTVTEGDLENPDAGNAYPVHGSSSVTIDSPSDNLDPSTLRLSDEGKSQLSSELSEITTHNGQPVEFSMTTDENGVVTISGVDAEGNAVLDITMTPTMSDNGDVTVTTEVNQYQPLDEMNGEGNIDGLITNNGDVISIDLPLEIDDTDGDTSNVDITVNFEDGQDPSFGDDTGVTITESDDTQTVSGSIEFDNGSDQVDQIVFDANQPSLDGITSNGEATSVVVEGSNLSLVDADGNPVMAVTIDANGNYEVTQYQPIDQNDGDITNIELNVSGTDADGDTANGTIHINIEDGENAADVADDVTVTEGDLENPDAGNAYPVHGSSSVTIASPDDNLNPSTLRLSDEGKAQLASEMGEITTHNGQPVEFSMTTDENGVVTISGVDGEGNAVLDITMTPTMSDNGDVTVTTEVNQYQPLDEMNGEGNIDGLITNNGDVISIDLPLEIDDTDGDTSNVDITVNFEDGQDPSFGDDTGVTITESDDTQTVSGSIEFDNGSDQVDQIVFDANQPSLDGITSNGEATSVVVDGSTLTLVDVNGDPVMDVTIDAQGNYDVTQYQPIDQNDGDITNIELNVSGTDADGDTATGTIHINIEDADAIDAADTVVITEGDLEDGENYPVSGSHSVVVDSASDDLKPETLHINPDDAAGLESDLDGLTSNGQPIDFTLVQNDDGTIQIQGNLADGSNILTMNMTPTLDADGNVTVTTDVTQNGPLDHLDESSDYITINGDQISIDVPLVMEDNDGTETNIDITVNIEDGQDPSFGSDTGATLAEGDDGVDTGSGDIHVDTGSDEVVDVRFGNDQSQLDGLTSNGQETSVIVSEDGHTLSIVDADNNPVMVVTIDQEGHYEVEQSQPIDQINEDDDISDLNLNVEVEDADGDIGKGQITIHDTDGSNATGGGDISVDFTEGDLTPDAGDDDAYGKTISSDKVHVEPGSDDLDPSTVQVDPTVMNDLIVELNSEVTTAGGEAVVFSFDSETGVLQGVDADGNPVLDINLIAEPTADGGVDISVDMTQYQPIDHIDGDTTGYVQSQGDSITINVPIQIQDTDGDYLDEAIDFNAVIHDGEDPVIISADSITVDESQIDAGGENHQGSNADGNGQTATGTITTDSGSDGFTHYVVDVDAFNENNDITSNGEEVTLVDNGDGTFSGTTESGNEVFNITFSEDGSYTFTVTGALDDPMDENGGEYITVDIPIYGIDDDGDVSNTINAEVTIKDDVPTATDITNSVEEGSGMTYMGDILTDAGEGADGAKVTGIVVDGEVVALDTLPTEVGPDGNTYYVYELQDSDDGNQTLGNLYISDSGEVYFDPNDNIDHDGTDLSEIVQFVVTDGDGDTDTADVNVVVTDQGPKMDVSGGSGQEEDGRHSIDPNDNVDDNTREGIEINMTLDVGDVDENEHLGDVVITPQGEAHGVFEYNGEPITPNDDGSITIPSDAFELQDNGDGTFSYVMNGITFVPDEDFSTVDGDLAFDVSAEVIDEDSREEFANGTFNITVDGIADTPTWNTDNTQTQYTVNEDSENVAIKVDVDLNDTDGSENLVYHVKMTEGEGEIVHIDGMTGPDENGYYTIPADSIDQLAVDPADNYSGDIKLDIYATSEETGDVVEGHETADSEHQEIVINVTPDSDAIDLHTSNNIKADEDTAIHLSDVVKPNTSVDTDGSETYFVRISGLPDGAEVIVNGEVVEPDENGFYVIPLDDVDNTDIMPPPQSNEDFSFTIDGMVIDDASLTDENGNPIPTEDSDIFDSTTVNVDMKGIADEPVIINDSDDWAVSDDGKTISTTVNEDGTATIDFSFASGEYAADNIDGAVNPDSDHSETISFAAADLPEGVTFSDADGNPLEPTLVSTNPDVYQLDVDDLKGLQIHTPENSSTDIDIPVRIVVTEDDGNAKSFDYTIHVNVNPEVDGVGVDDNGDLKGYHTDSSGLEDGLVKLNWDPTSQLVDKSEKVVGLTINGFEEGYSIVIDGEVIEPDENGSITLTDEQLAAAESDGIYLQMPEDVDTDIHLTTDVTIADQEADDPEAATAVIHGDLDVDVTSVVEEDGHAEIDDEDGNAIVDTDGDGISDLYEDQDSDDSWSNQIHLTADDVAGSDGYINWINDDASSDEVVTKVIISFDKDSVTDANGNPVDWDSIDNSGFFIPGAINNGDGTFTVTQDQLDDITINAPRGFDGSVDIHVTVEVQDQGDGTEEDVSETVSKDVDLTLHFTDDHDDGGNGGNYVEPKAADVTAEDTSVTADEDTSVNLGDVIASGIHSDTSDNDGDGQGDQTNDTISIIIDADDLPEGATIDGMVYNESTGEYVYSVTPDADGNVDLSEITMDLPPDYAGTIDIPVKVVETDNTSGDTNSSTMNVNVDVNPVADAPDISITVNGTTGLDPDTMQPTEDGSGSVDGAGYEDGIISLSLNAIIGDGNNGGVDNGGLETINNITLTVDPSQGQFVDADGNPIGDENGSITIDDINEPIYFKPADDFSGSVNIHVSGDTTDTAIVDGEEVSDTSGFETDVSFDVVAVNDDVDISGGEDLHGDEGSSIPLTDVTGTLTDLDGSEHIVSVSISGVPDDFIVEGGQNMGDGVWALPDAIDSDTTLDLSDISILPPEDFSGDVTFTLRVYTQEDSLSDPVEKDIPITIHVDAKADAVNSDVVTEASGDENDADGIVLHFNAHDVDDSASTNAADNVNEDGPEQVQITISNVPEGATFEFPEGEDGTITYNDDGTVTIISSGSDLDSIIFHPGDANSDNWDGNLDIAIQGNDQGDTSGPVTNETIHVDVNAQNDAAVNTVPETVQASAEGSTTITGLHISDVDAAEGKGNFTVQLHVENGSLSLPEGTDTSGLVITADEDGNYTVEGSIDDINSLFDGGIIYTPDAGFSGDDSITMSTTDNGDADGNDRQTTTDTITITDVVSTESADSGDTSNYSATYAPTTPAQDIRSHLAATAAQVNAASVMPLAALLLSAAVTANEGETLELNHLGGAQIVDGDNQPLGTVAEDGSVTLTAAQVAVAYVQQPVESITTEFTVVTKSADNRVVGEHNVSTASINTTGLDSQRDVAEQHNTSASANNAEHVQSAAAGEAEHAVEGQNAADLLAANPEMAEQLSEHAEQLSDDLHAIVDEVSTLSQDNIDEAVANKVSELQQDVHDATTQNDVTNQDLSLADNPFEHANDVDELASNEDSTNYFEPSSQGDDVLNADDTSDDFDSEQDSLYSNDDASDSSIYADDANQDDGFFGDDDDSFDWDHLAANGLDGGLDNDMSGMEMTDDVMMQHSDSDFDVSDLLDQDDHSGNLDMDKLLGEAAPSSAADIGKPGEATADDLASTQHLDQPDVSGMGMDLSGLHDTSSAGHIINDLFDPNSMKPTDG